MGSRQAVKNGAVQPAYTALQALQAMLCMLPYKNRRLMHLSTSVAGLLWLLTKWSCNTVVYNLKLLMKLSDLSGIKRVNESNKFLVFWESLRYMYY